MYGRIVVCLVVEMVVVVFKLLGLIGVEVDVVDSQEELESLVARLAVALYSFVEVKLWGYMVPSAVCGVYAVGKADREEDEFDMIL